MSKKPSILEGEVARTLGRADKLKIMNVRGGASLWVPEDTVQTMTKRITKNGTYKAKDDGKYGYSEVTVAVPGNRVVGEGPDGNDHIVSEELDPEGNPTGNLIDDVAPSAIRIVRPPAHTSYTAGEAISFDGLSVVMLKKDGTVFTDAAHPNGVLSHDELDFPITIAGDGGGSSGTWSDGNGLNAIRCTFSESENHTYQASSQRDYYGTIRTLGQSLGTSINFGDYREGLPITIQSDIGDGLFLTKYNGVIYGAGIGGGSKQNLAILFNGEESGGPYSVQYWGWNFVTGIGGGFGEGVFTGGSVQGNCDLSAVPESTVNPNGMSVDNLTPQGGEDIPVNWGTGSYNLGKTFTDSFEITVSGSSGEFSGSGGGTF